MLLRVERARYFVQNVFKYEMLRKCRKQKFNEKIETIKIVRVHS